jgi:hypothetical protein
MKPGIGSNQRPGGLGIRFSNSAGQSFPRREEALTARSRDHHLSMRLSMQLVLASASLAAAAADTTVRK